MPGKFVTEGTVAERRKLSQRLLKRVEELKSDPKREKAKVGFDRSLSYFEDHGWKPSPKKRAVKK